MIRVINKWIDTYENKYIESQSNDNLWKTMPDDLHDELIKNHGHKAFDYLRVIYRTYSKAMTGGSESYHAFIGTANSLLVNMEVYNKFLSLSEEVKISILASNRCLSNGYADELLTLVHCLDQDSDAAKIFTGNVSFERRLSGLRNCRDDESGDFSDSIFAYLYIHDEVRTSLVHILYMLRVLVGEKTVLELISKCQAESHVLAPGEATALANNWEKVKEFPLKWSILAVSKGVE